MAGSSVRSEGKAVELEAQGWKNWLRTVFPFAFPAEFSWFQEEFWSEWWEVCQSIKHGREVPPASQNFLLLWGRALAKSSSGTPSTLMKAAFAGSTYSIYLSETIDQASSHLANIRYLITHPDSKLVEYYPHLELTPLVPTTLGLKSKDTENVFITKGGSIFRALGIDSAARGLILGGKRPDDFNLDDLDDVSHGLMVSSKNLKRLTRSILLTRDIASDLVVTTKILQNIVIEHGVVNQIHTGKSDAFAERTTIGVVNTFEKLEMDSYINDKGMMRHKILPDSIPSWEAVSIPKAQAILDLIGLDAFLAECQNKFDQFKSGYVISNYNEAAQVITWSQFENMFGERRIPRHWKCLAGLDIGYSTGEYPHYSAWNFIATSAMNSPMPNALFVYRSRSFTGTSIDDQATLTIDELYPEEKSMISTWQMSHERTGEMLTLNQKYKLPFGKFAHWKAEDGVAQWKHLSMCDKTQANPFHEDEQLEDGLFAVGRPQLYYIVDDDQLKFPRDDNGLKLLRDQVSTWQYVPVKLTEAGQTVQRPSKVNDDHCFVAGTQIQTLAGLKPIEAVTTQDWALTRQGYKKVRAAGLTQAKGDVWEVEFSNGRRLQGTSGHPIFVEGKGFVLLRHLKVSDIIFPLWQTTKSKRNPSELCSAALPFIGIQKRSSDLTGSTFHPTLLTEGKGFSPCILRFGNQLMAMFRQITTFITKTAIRLTMMLPIWSVLRKRSITKNTTKTVRLYRLNWQKAYAKHGTLLKHGTALMRDGDGILNTLRTLCLAIANPRPQCAFSAASPSQVSTPGLSFAQSTATNSFTNYQSRSSVNTKSSATNAAILPAQTIPTNDSVTVRAVRRLEIEKPVYNLSVEDVPEYFANGVLVHNCDVIKSLLAYFGAQSASLTPTEKIIAAIPEGLQEQNIQSPGQRQGQIMFLKNELEKVNKKRTEDGWQNSR